MDLRSAKTVERRTNIIHLAPGEIDTQLVQRRLNGLLALNAESSRQKELYRSPRQKLEAEMMRRPLSFEQAFAYFGLMLGAFPPAAIILKMLFDDVGLRDPHAWILLFFVAANIVTAFTGYFSGILVGKAVRETMKFRGWRRMALLPFIGLTWGLASGGAGGIFIFLIGSIVGAVIGGAVGTIALPTFALLHHLTRRGESIDTKHFLPLALGITFAICGFILSL